MHRRYFLAGSIATATGCRHADRIRGKQVSSPRPQGSGPRSPGLVIHGGAGTIPKSLPVALRKRYVEGLNAALRLGVAMLKQGATSLDTVESVVRNLEDNPRFNAGRGAVYTHNGIHELDAAIMDGRTLGCGSVTGVRTVKHPISLARHVMEKTRHVFFAGPGAEAFADTTQLERVPPSYFDTPERYEAWQKELKRISNGAAPSDNFKKGTVGAVALDEQGNLAAATSTGGLTNKMFGRVGDVPIIGAGTYANNSTCAISCTGTGEEFIRNNVAHDVSALMEYRGWTLQQAAEEVVFRKLKPGDGGLIAVSRDGSMAMVYNSTGMYRGAANVKGRFEVAIWESPISS